MMEHATKLQKFTNRINKHFNLNSCGYFLVFDNGETLHLTNKYKLEDKLIQQHLKINGRLSITNYLQHVSSLGFYLIDCEPNYKKQRGNNLDKLYHARDFCHEFISIDRILTSRGSAFRIVSFTAPNEINHINQFYINNLELLHKIIRQISKDLQPTIDTIPLIKPNQIELELLGKFKTRAFGSNTNNIKAYVSETGLHYPKYNELSDIVLNEREKDLIYWYLRGKSTYQTSKILNISPATVRTYFERLKSKLGCYFKPQILLKLIDGGFIKPDDWRDIY